MKVFDYLHQELSLTLDRQVSRFELWTSMATQDAHPLFNLTPEKAANYLETGTGKILNQSRQVAGKEKWGRLIERVRQFDPERQTPDEILERLCSPSPKPD